MAEERRYQRRAIRGYIPTVKLRPDLIDFVLRRRGPARPVIERTVRERMKEYAQAMGIDGTLPELIVHYELTRRGLEDGIHFDFQSSFAGGRLQLGGAVVDFLFLDRPLAVRVQGEYWHTEWQAMGGGKSDEEQRMLLRGYGYLVLDLWESTVMNPDEMEDWMARNIDTPVVRLP